MKVLAVIMLEQLSVNVDCHDVDFGEPPLLISGGSRPIEMHEQIPLVETAPATVIGISGKGNQKHIKRDIIHYLWSCHNESVDKIQPWGDVNLLWE